MKIRHFIIKAFVCFALLLAARADALSTEALAAIDEMRVRINTVAISKESPDDAESGLYIPGMELKAALSRMRAGIYGTNVPDRFVEPDSAQRISSDSGTMPYQPGAMLQKALGRLRAGRVDYMPPIDKDTVLDRPAFTPEVLQPPPAQPAEPESAKNGSYELLENADAALADISNPEEIPVTKEKTEAVPARAGKKASGASSPKTASPVTEEKTGRAPEDQEFNDFIRRYDFKMPDNYRIIVR
ncbi:MAG: hypothetical protein EOM80_16305 [Erysipelotrichia bacterium]|nr:hypothetical protein [Erysipelotrichia bacterium]